MPGRRGVGTQRETLRGTSASRPQLSPGPGSLLNPKRQDPEQQGLLCPVPVLIEASPRARVLSWAPSHTCHLQIQLLVNVTIFLIKSSLHSQVVDS